MQNYCCASKLILGESKVIRGIIACVGRSLGTIKASNTSHSLHILTDSRP